MEHHKLSYEELEKRVEDLSLRLDQQQSYSPISDSIYNTVFNKSFDAIVLIDENKIISDCNPAYEKLTGYSYRELIGMDVAKLIHPDYLNDLDAMALEFESTGRVSLERQNIHKIGTPYWIELNGNFVFIKGKKQFLAIIRDISKRKKIEQKLQENKQFYCDSLNGMLTMLAVLKPSGEIIFANKTSLYINKIDLEDVQGEMFHSIFWWQYSNEAAQAVKNDIDQCAKGKKITREIKIETKERGLLYIRFSIHPISDEDGNVKYLVAEGMDITDRKQIEAKLSSQEQFIKHLINSVPGILYVIDKNGRFLHWNKNLEKVTGCSSQELASKKFLDFFEGEAISIMKDGIDEAFLEGKAIKEVDVITKTGQKIPYLLSGMKVDFQNQKYIAGVGLDLTERNKMEEQIRQTQKIEAVGQLVGGVAHDFNNMLGVVFGHAELALSNLTPNDPIERNLLNIKKAAERSADLTGQLLAFSRKQIIRPQPIKINTLISSMLKMIGRLIGENIEHHFVSRKNLWKVRLDPSQIDQIIANLAINARDAMPNGGELIIETQNITVNKDYCSNHMSFSPGQYVMISISDNGTGMDKTTMSHIFEPFFTTKKIGMGTGLGLSTVYGIIKQNNGFINVYSEPGHGTTFKLYIPRWIGEEEQSVIKNDRKQPSGIGTILLVEDDKMVRDLTNEILVLHGHNVIVASSPEQALEYCRNEDQKIQILLTDVIMPGMNGKELKKAIENIRPKIKTIFMSGYTTNIIAHHGVLDDAINFISKPFNPDDLLIKVSDVLGEL
ncbi:MAG: PAS domain S-box protein [Desulfobacula sp.]|nr:PAS domain S-box protein [Desulfobacula sp.]